jgi:CHAT domain-containing protein/Flp pilus assembly protein TadD
VALLLLSGPGATAADPPEQLTPERRQELEKKAVALNEEGWRHNETGNYAKAIEVFREALESTRALYPKGQYPDGHPDLATSINCLGFMHYSAGEYGKAEPLLRDGLDMRRALYPESQFPDGHPDLARSLNNLGVLHLDAGAYGKAESLFREALQMRRRLFPKEKHPDGHPDLAQSLNNLGSLYRHVGAHDQAEPLYRDALEMTRALYPKARFPGGHPDLATSLNNLASLHSGAGEDRLAEPLYREALAMTRALYPKARFPGGHPELAGSLNNLGLLYRGAGECGKAEPLLREALEMTRGLFPQAQYPNGHPDLAQGLNNLGVLHLDAGEYGKAETLFREALAMTRALYPKARYPDGHAELAKSLHNLAGVHKAAKEYGKAEPLLREALEMTRALFPKDKYANGHPDLARSLNNLGALYQDAGEYAKAETLYRQALEMYRALFPRTQYPNGHPELATSLNNLGMLHREAGELGKAETLYREGLDMLRARYPKARYPDGHPLLAGSLHNLGTLHCLAGEPGKAESLLRDGLEITRALLRRHADLAAEAEALNYAASQPHSRGALLSVTRDGANPDAVYGALWDSRALLMRLQEQRHRSLAASSDPALRSLADQLRLARLTLSRRLLRPLKDAEENTAEVRRLTDAKEDLEKRLAAAMHLPPLPPAGTPAPQRLAARLPAGCCFLDLYRYTHYEQDPNVRGKKGEKRTPEFVAFVVRPGKATARVELGDAEAIERAWADWRQAITAQRSDAAAERTAAAVVGRLVWEPLRRELPADLTTVYLTADAALHQLPWAALPGGKAGTVLLEEHALCLVPHGPFLLQRLEEKPLEATTTARLLAVGGIDYQDRTAGADAAPPFSLREPALAAGGVRWPALAGTDRERQQVAALARQAARVEVTERAGQEATTAQFQRALPGVRYAHVATHGFFADPKFRSALQIDPKEFGALGVRDRRGGARSPLALSGLVFAGANQTGNEAADDRGILTAEGLIGLRLEGLELAVLSACETGLGEAGGGEGVYGLQRAFHVAGCRDVVASLWKVNDGATQALMALFYRNLWEKKMSAAEALRQAQLTLYRNPTAVEVARNRGVDFSESDLPREAEKPLEKGKHSPTAHWAAFTFSGVRPVKGQ